MASRKYTLLHLISISIVSVIVIFALLPAYLKYRLKANSTESLIAMYRTLDRRYMGVYVEVTYVSSGDVMAMMSDSGASIYYDGNIISRSAVDASGYSMENVNNLMHMFDDGASYNVDYNYSISAIHWGPLNNAILSSIMIVDKVRPDTDMPVYRGAVAIHDSKITYDLSEGTFDITSLDGRSVTIYVNEYINPMSSRVWISLGYNADSKMWYIVLTESGGQIGYERQKVSIIECNGVDSTVSTGSIIVKSTNNKYYAIGKCNDSIIVVPAMGDARAYVKRAYVKMSNRHIVHQKGQKSK